MDIKGYEGLYKIYEDGRVWGVKRQKFLKPSTHRDGYIQVVICKDSKPKTYYIHRLIALHYIDNPNNYLEVDHINRLKTDNRIENLRWATRSENNINKTFRKNNKLKLKNISTYGNRYYINIQRKGVIYRKWVKTENEAIAMRDAMLEELD